MPASQRSLPVGEPGAMAAAEAARAAGHEVASRAPPFSGVPATPSTALAAASLVPAGASGSVVGVDAVDGTWATASSATESELAYDAPSAGAASLVVGGPDGDEVAVLVGSAAAAEVAKGGDVLDLEAVVVVAAVAIIVVPLPISTPAPAA